VGSGTGVGGAGRGKGASKLEKLLRLKLSGAVGTSFSENTLTGTGTGSRQGSRGNLMSGTPVSTAASATPAARRGVTMLDLQAGLGLGQQDTGLSSVRSGAGGGMSTVRSNRGGGKNLTPQEVAKSVAAIFEVRTVIMPKYRTQPNPSLK
jgi:hypothetical protein